MGEVGDVNIMAAGIDGIDAPVVIRFGGGAEIPINKGVIRCRAEEIPVNHAARINKVNFQILRIGNLFTVKAGGGKAFQPINRPTLQQLGQGPFQGHFKAGMRPKAGKTALVFRVQ